MWAVATFVACEGVALLAMLLDNEAWLRELVYFVLNKEDTMSSERES